MDKAGSLYWERLHRAAETRTDIPSFDPRRGRTRDYWKRRFHEYFQFALGDLGSRGQRLVEVGAGGSIILPYLGREFGFHVVGLDYSTTGCLLAEQNLQREGVKGDVLCADVFDLPAEVMGQADVVVSFGVVEHFADPADCMRACSRLLKPGGVMVTTVPNMAGLVGQLQRLLDPAVFQRHVALDVARLRDAHERAGMTVLDTRYVLFINLGVVNINEAPPGVGRAMRGAALTVLKGITGVLWFFEQTLGALPPNALTSPYVFCLARKPSA
jgi:2-polyprenyl-3-methyl-5-hydroxy-6-metoxy-1,4-benzoquinol methylase